MPSLHDRSRSAQARPPGAREASTNGLTLNEPPIVANAFSGCQLRWLLCYSRRPSRLASVPSDHMRVWSLPEVFHTCGKNCGKSQFLTIRSYSGPILRRSGEGETAKSLQTWARRAPILAKG